jgi:actin-related protein
VKDSKEETRDRSTTITLPDGTQINLAKIPQIIEDVLFFPRKLGFETRSLSEQVSFVLADVPIDLRKTLAANIILSGGNANIPNLRERIGRTSPGLLSGLTPSL